MPGIDSQFEHEQAEIFRDPETGATGVIAIHSTALGPAMGGLRLAAYAGLESAMGDALRLARAMTLKNAAAGLDLGGGKAVLLDDGGWADPVARASRMRAVGETIERLGGRYVTAEDVGTTPDDMTAIAGATPHVAGQPVELGGRGDPSPWTARTVAGAIEAAARLRLDTEDLAGVRVGVLGVGHVGRHLVALLREAGADVVVADIDPARADEAAAEYGAQAVPAAGFLRTDVDVLAPCAMGELIHPEHIGELRCRVIAGAANNPLLDAASARALADTGILYVPDFLANCGGIIHVGAEVLGFADAEVERRIGVAVAHTEAVLREALQTRAIPLDVAVAEALARIAGAQRG
ncbi:MAG: Glu/Leu/Phe/Val dehydrogenase [Solirubrobacteraceae bacterium]|nr:Glu/Leu/Phe/Val dehydrogenase [Solirubrobacteraceae bacterium]